MTTTTDKMSPSYSFYMRKRLAGDMEFQSIFDSFAMYAIDKMGDDVPDKFLILNIQSEAAEVAEIKTIRETKDDGQEIIKFAILSVRCIPHGLNTLPEGDFTAILGGAITFDPDTQRYSLDQTKVAWYADADVILKDYYAKAVATLIPAEDIPAIIAVRDNTFGCPGAIFLALQPYFNRLLTYVGIPAHADYPSKGKVYFLRDIDSEIKKISTSQGEIDFVKLMRPKPTKVTVPLDRATLASRITPCATWGDILPEGTTFDYEIGEYKMAEVQLRAVFDSMQNVFLIATTNDGSLSKTSIVYYGVEQQNNIAGEGAPAPKREEKEERNKEEHKKEKAKNTPAKKEATKKETTKKEASKKEEPKKETSKKETAKKETSKKEEPKKETAKKEEPKKEPKPKGKKPQDAQPKQPAPKTPEPPKSDFSDEVMVFAPDIYVKCPKVIAQVKDTYQTLIMPMIYDGIDQMKRNNAEGKMAKDSENACAAMENIREWFDTSQVIYDTEHSGADGKPNVNYTLLSVINLLKKSGRKPIIFTDDLRLKGNLSILGLSSGSYADFTASPYYTAELKKPEDYLTAPNPKSPDNPRTFKKLKDTVTPNNAETVVIADTNIYHKCNDIISHVNEQCNTIVTPAVAEELLMQSGRKGALATSAQNAIKCIMKWDDTDQKTTLVADDVKGHKMFTGWWSKFLLDWGKTGDNKILHVAMSMMSGYKNASKAVEPRNVVLISNDKDFGFKIQLCNMYLKERLQLKTNLTWMTLDQFKASPYYTETPKTPDKYKNS